MKKQTVLITVARGVSENAMLRGSYTVKGVTHTLLVTGEVVTRKLQEHERPFNKAFTATDATIHYEFDWTALDEDDKADMAQIEREKAVIHFYENHPLVKPTHCHNPNLIVAPICTMEILEQKEGQSYKEIMQRLKVANKFLECPQDFQRDMCYLFSKKTPTSMTKEQMVIDMLDFEVGNLMNNENGKKFLSIAENGLTSDISVTIETERAIKMGVITMSDGKYYLPTGEQIGLTVADCSMYFKTHPKEYEFVVKAATDKDGAATVKKEEEKEAAPEAKPVVNVLEQLQLRAKELGVKKWHVMGVQKLREAIEEAEKQLA